MTVEADHIFISKAQIDCLALIEGGSTFREISNTLGITLDEVESTLDAACRRLGVRTRFQAAIICREIGVI